VDTSEFVFVDFLHYLILSVFGTIRHYRLYKIVTYLYNWRNFCDTVLRFLANRRIFTQNAQITIHALRTPGMLLC
jgi:hypothetical protein